MMIRSLTSGGVKVGAFEELAHPKEASQIQQQIVHLVTSLEVI